MNYELRITNYKKLFYCFIVSLLAGFFIFSFNVVLADGLLPDKESAPATGSACTSDNCGNYTLNDMMQVFVNVSEWILGIVGSLALLMFIYGGVMFLISGGSAEKVTQAKQIIAGAVIGLVIVFTSYIIITFAAQALGIEVTGGILQSGWLQ